MRQFLINCNQPLARRNYVAENPVAPNGSNCVAQNDTGCLSPLNEWNYLLYPDGVEKKLTNNPLGTLCFSHGTMGSLLEARGPKCEGGAGYWSDTAIVITWDDWGGWYDHVTPRVLFGSLGSYQYGFRVPLLAVSAYTPKAYVDNMRHDFGSIQRFIEAAFGIPEGSLGLADARATGDLSGFFKFEQSPREFRSIKAPLDANFFIHDTRPPDPPDTD
jgi:phosphoesterase family protein